MSDWNRSMDEAPRDGRKLLLTDGTEVKLCAWEDEAFRGATPEGWVAARYPDSGWASDYMLDPTGWQEPPAP